MSPPRPQGQGERRELPEKSQDSKTTLWDKEVDFFFKSKRGTPGTEAGGGGTRFRPPSVLQVRLGRPRPARDIFSLPGAGPTDPKQPLGKWRRLPGPPTDSSSSPTTELRFPLRRSSRIRSRAASFPLLRDGSGPVSASPPRRALAFQPKTRGPRSWGRCPPTGVRVLGPSLRVEGISRGLPPA